jgi:predicted acetyltransferase
VYAYRAMVLGLRRLFTVTPFRHLDPGRLVDRELELVPPSEELLEAVMAACTHPLTSEHQPDLAKMTREELRHQMQVHPGGLQKGNPYAAAVPGYHFWMRVETPIEGVSVAGGISLRIAWTKEVEVYYGHVGYHVYPPFRGRRYAERAVRLLLPLAKSHGLKVLWITTNPENLASRRTCERLGARMVEIVNVPRRHALYHRGDHHKCRYRLEL